MGTLCGVCPLFLGLLLLLPLLLLIQHHGTFQEDKVMSQGAYTTISIVTKNALSTEMLMFFPLFCPAVLLSPRWQRGQLSPFLSMVSPPV